jgi:ADP-heptose:LPS heptosyltransferase
MVDNVLTISTATGWKFVRDTIGVIIRMRAESVDTVFDLEFFAKFSTLLGTLSGARRRVGFALPTLWRRWNLTASVPLDRSAHVAVMFQRQLQPFGETTRAAFPAITSTAADRVSMANKLGLTENGSPIIVVNINADAVSLERRWSPERFAAVLRAVAAMRPGATFFLSGARTEQTYVAEMIKRWKLPDNVHNVAGALSLGEFVALLERSDVLLTCDSGPVHFASAVGTPVVALFGPESPAFYGPLGQSVSVYSGIACSPCLNIYAAKRFVCPYNARCMDMISVEEVVEALRRVLGNPRNVRRPDTFLIGTYSAKT